MSKKNSASLIMNIYSGLIVGFAFLFGLILKVYKVSAKMRPNLVLYFGILIADLLVSGCMVVRNCVLRDVTEECSLTVGGAIGSVTILSLVMLLCPLYMTKLSPCEVIDSIRDGIKWKLKHVKFQRKEHQLLVENQQLLPTKMKQLQRFISLDENKNGIIVPDSNISIVPAGRGPIRGVSNPTNYSKPHMSEVKVKYTEVNET